ncbi:GNAT family N-acetyltransferase [Micromonospora sp. NPDC050417]|uniref:GNAT family N-acetyltransferase n=1 Tax=Micromonospora sp. NPDC050417 TaxID=3364280 RepID=UPI00378F3EB5
MSPRDLTRLAELTEAEVNRQYVTATSERGRVALGISAADIGGGFSLAMRNDPTGGGWNKTLGIGFAEPVTKKLIGEVVDFHREHGSPSAQVQIAPELLPPDWEDIREAFGLTPGGHMMKFACAVEDFKPGTTDLRVGLVDPQDVDKWATMLSVIFGMPEHFDSMIAGTGRRPDFRPLAAWDGDEMVAGGSLFIDGDVASLNTGATKASHRNRGIQSALLTARAQAAAEAGCRWLVTETGKPTEGESNSSYNNMLRSGFTLLYARQSWIWKPGGVVAA